MHEEKGSCVFCEIAAGKAPAQIICENELSICLLDIHPYAQGHCLVVPRRHVPWWHDLTDEETVSLFRLARLAANKIMNGLAPDFVCLFARGRRIPHTHIFLVPSRQGDVLDGFFNALEKFQESTQELARLKTPEDMSRAADLLRKAEPAKE